MPWNQVYRDVDVHVDVDPASAKRLSPAVGRITFRWTWTEPQQLRGVSYKSSLEVVEFDSHSRMTRTTSATLFDAAGEQLHLDRNLLDQRWTTVIADSIGSALADAVCPLLSLDSAAFRSRYKGLIGHEPEWLYAPAKMPSRQEAVIKPLIGDDAERLDVRDLPRTFRELLAFKLVGLPHLIAVGLMNLLAHAVAWYVLAWCFSLVAAGYLESLGRLNDTSAYYNMLRNGLQMPPLIGLGYGLITYLIFFSRLKSTVTNRNGLDSDGISSTETSRLRICDFLGVVIWALLGFSFARMYAPDLWIRGLLLGGFVGTFAHWGVLYSLHLIRRPLQKLWVEAIIIVGFAVTTLMSTTWIFSQLQSRIGNP